MGRTGFDPGQHHTTLTLRAARPLDGKQRWVGTTIGFGHVMHSDVKAGSTTLSVTGRCRYGTVTAPACAPSFRSDGQYGSLFKIVNTKRPQSGRLRDLPFERIGPKRVIYHAQKQTSHRPDENATYRARLDNADTSSAYDANDRKKDEDGATTKSKTNEDGSCQDREGENNAAQLFAETAGSFEGLGSGINFPIQSAKVRQPFHDQAVFVLFAIDKQFHQMLGKPFAGTLCLGSICKSAIDVQGAIDRQSIHGTSLGWGEPSSR
jgi:hypothetical protein